MVGSESAVIAVSKRFSDSNCESGVNALTAASVIFLCISRKERKRVMLAMPPEERSVMAVPEKSAVTIWWLNGGERRQFLVSEARAQ